MNISSIDKAEFYPTPEFKNVLAAAESLKAEYSMHWAGQLERLSGELGIPKSTVRWNLRGLREAGLIRAGDRENKGIPVVLTEMGQLMAEYMASM